MKDRDVHHLAQSFFDHEAFRRLDVLKINAAEGGTEITDGGDEFFDVFSVDFEID